MTVLRSVFGDLADQMTEDDGPGTLEAWDSVTHLNLILAVEAEFGVQFDTAEIPELLSVGKIRGRLEH